MQVNQVSSIQLNDWPQRHISPAGIQIRVQKIALDIQKEMITDLLDKTLNSLGSIIDVRA